MQKYMIYRDSWMRGDHDGSLYDPLTSTQCCIGQICSQIGIPLDDLADIEMPSGLEVIDLKKYPKLELLVSGIEGSMFADKKDSASAASVNDAADIEEDVREHGIKTRLSKLGLDIQFVDGVAPWFKPLPEAAC